MSSAEQDAIDRTMGLYTVWDVLSKLEWELLVLRELENRAPAPAQPPIGAIDDPRANLYASINALSTAWSVADWVWRIIEDDPAKCEIAGNILAVSLVGNSAQERKKQFLLAVRKAAFELDICHQVCNATKHRKMIAKALTQGFSVDVWVDVHTNDGGVVALVCRALPTQSRAGGGATSTTPYSAARTAESFWHDILRKLGESPIPTRPTAEVT